jgi:hypothetical protein
MASHTTDCLHRLLTNGADLLRSMKHCPASVQLHVASHGDQCSSSRPIGPKVRCGTQQYTFRFSPVASDLGGFRCAIADFLALASFGFLAVAFLVIYIQIVPVRTFASRV